MSEEKKDKPQVDVRDLKPNKDAKGGGGHSAQGGRKSAKAAAKSTSNHSPAPHGGFNLLCGKAGGH